ncbi:MAG: 16S rRNA (cytosine(967)-C(5))-methyltransferase RsmB [Gracilibacteraceae bacterium]|jgi:16S rRNA (cytosine967-C5)-methyltransferase|nr:16S rRNA (cytosine(967)-C(5))-methyltransferase RsmB [Gracilibacteraceae bacterium]
MDVNRQTAGARDVAAALLTRVEKEEAYAHILLRQMLPALADARERQLASALVNGVLKQRGALDYILRRHLRKPLRALPAEARAALRMGAFQLLYLERVPAAAAVNESVRITKQTSPPHAALVNAVLRSVAVAGWDVVWPDPSRQPAEYISARYSLPRWLARRWLRRWGREETEKLCLWNNEPAETWLRANKLRCGREDLIAALLALETCRPDTIRPGAWAPEAVRLTGGGTPEALPPFRAGLCTVQDESSQLAAILLAPAPGERILDACAAPGGKTVHMAELMENKGKITALDIHPAKLALIEDNATRLGAEIITPQTGDARELPVREHGAYDKILVDAPCSGFGVMRRRADLRWQKKEQDVGVLPFLQLAILLGAAKAARPGGELVYATCTVEPEENFDVAKAFIAARPDFKPVPLAPFMPFACPSPADERQWEKGMWQILPQRHGMDGFFLAKFRREDKS